MEGNSAFTDSSPGAWLRVCSQDNCFWTSDIRRAGWRTSAFILFYSLSIWMISSWKTTYIFRRWIHFRGFCRRKMHLVQHPEILIRVRPCRHTPSSNKDIWVKISAGLIVPAEQVHTHGDSRLITEVSGPRLSYGTPNSSTWNFQRSLKECIQSSNQEWWLYVGRKAAKARRWPPMSWLRADNGAVPMGIFLWGMCLTWSWVGVNFSAFQHIDPALGHGNRDTEGNPFTGFSLHLLKRMPVRCPNERGYSI